MKKFFNRKSEQEPQKPSAKEKWVKKIMKESNLSREDVLKLLKEAKDSFGIKPSLYYKRKMWEMTPAQMARRVLYENRKEENRNIIYADIEACSGKTKETIRGELKRIREMEVGFVPTLEWYYRYGLYSIDIPEDEYGLNRVIHYSEVLKLSRVHIKEALERIDDGKLSYDSIMPEVNEYYHIVDYLISDLKINAQAKLLIFSVPALKEDSALRRKAAVDMIVSEDLLGFTESEYISFNFLEKSFEEKREYISSVERAVAIKLLSTPDTIELMNDKFESYRRLEKYYGREIIQIERETGYDAFMDFCSRHAVFVKKNGYDSLGRGIMKVEITPDTDLSKLFLELTEDVGPVILEELISAGDAIRKLNPDSVNTVRIIVLTENRQADILYCFMKIGRAGSFIDNGGAGGLFVHIDNETGTFDSDAINENGIRFDTHPDHGYQTRGIVLPDWNQAIETAKKAALEIEGLGMIGWDMTYTSEGRWIIVEGNSLTQFIAQQGTMKRGLKQEFYDKIDFKNKWKASLETDDSLQ